jgi:hypothetical protein
VRVVHVQRLDADLRARDHVDPSADEHASAAVVRHSVRRLPGRRADDRRGWGNNAINTFDYGYFGPNILSLRIVVPAGASTSKTTSWVEYGTAPFARDAVLSTAACDFSNANALKKGSGQVARSAPDTMRFSFNYTTGAPSMFSVHVEPGQVYYLNVRNRFSDGSLSCPIPSCAMRGGFPQ